jgi:hypothetical protein
LATVSTTISSLSSLTLLVVACSSGNPSGLSASLGGAKATTSTPSFTTADQEILYHAVRFYGAERCGDAHNYTLNGNPNGTSCHMHDGESIDLDLVGEWHGAQEIRKLRRR